MFISSNRSSGFVFILVTAFIGILNLYCVLIINNCLDLVPTSTLVATQATVIRWTGNREEDENTTGNQSELEVIFNSVLPLDINSHLWSRVDILLAAPSDVFRRKYLTEWYWHWTETTQGCLATWCQEKTVRCSLIDIKRLAHFFCSCATDPLVHHGRHFGRTVHALCTVSALLNNGLLRLGELADQPNEAFTHEYVFFC
jgi:hypothetical protein